MSLLRSDGLTCGGNGPPQTRNAIAWSRTFAGARRRQPFWCGYTVIVIVIIMKRFFHLMRSLLVFAFGIAFER